MSKKLCIIGFIFIIFFISINGTINNFINPTLVVCLYISLPILILFLISDFKGKKANKNASIIFIIPVILGIMAMGGNISEAYTLNLAKQNYNTFNINKVTKQEILDENNEENIQNNKKSEQNNEKIEETIKENGEVINVNDDNYMDTLNNVYQNVDQYIGTTINIEGCIFREGPEIDENQFCAGKYYIYCCAADMSLVGFLYQYNNYQDVIDGKWYKIQAVVSKRESEDPYYGKYTEPLLMVKDISEINKPNNTVVYQNY